MPEGVEGARLRAICQTPAGTTLTPGARTVLFLACDEGAFITGSTISVNGGQHMY